MGTYSPSGSSANVSISQSSAVTIAEQLLTLANTEYTINLLTNLNTFVLKARTPCVLKIRTTSAGPYLTLAMGAVLRLDSMTLGPGNQLFIESNQPGTVLEMISLTL